LCAAKASACDRSLCVRGRWGCRCRVSPSSLRSPACGVLVVSAYRGDSTSFLGRDADVERVGAAFRASRLVVVVGPGGAGKTRLARHLLELDRRSANVFCDLSSARSMADVVSAMAGALEVAIDARTSSAAASQIATVLAARGDALVVLDNLEGIENPTE